MFPNSSTSNTLTPFAQHLEQIAAKEELQALIQFSFLKPYLAELSDACKVDNLELIVLKGAALAETIYPRPSLRLFGDIDVLIRASDVIRARTLLETLGYAADEGQWRELIEGYNCQVNFFKHPERGAVVVELHTQLINNPFFYGMVQFEEAAVWARAESACLAGKSALVLGPEDQLLHLCQHLACHYLAAPRSLRDIDQLCRACAIDWPLFLTIAERSSAKAACFASLYVVHHLLGTPLPQSTLDELAPGFGRRLLEQLAITRASDLTESRTEALRFPLLMQLLETPAARRRAILQILFPSSRWLISHYYFDRYSATVPAHLTWQSHLALIAAHWTALFRRLGRLMRKH